MNVNWWLMGLAFVLGSVITLAFMIRRVKREVPVYAAAGAAGGATAAGLASAKPKPDVAKAEAPKVDTSVTSTATTAAAGAAGGAAAAKLVGSAGDSETEKISAVGEEPYGAGSLRTTRGASAPSGYTIKGNENSMLYHAPESPSYGQTIAEVWFRDEPTAKGAGFTRWDEGGGGGAAKFASTAAEIPPGPHGPGSAAPGADGSGPSGWTVKGNEDSKLYHSTESPSYSVTRAEVWFRDVETAEAAGFNRWDSGKSQRGRK